MKTRGIIGRRIVAVRQGMCGGESARAAVNAVDFIELDNGIRLFPHVSEHESFYSVDFVVNKMNTKGLRRRP